MTVSEQAKKLAFYLQVRKSSTGATQEECSAAQDYREYLAPIEESAQAAWRAFNATALEPLSDFDLPADDFACVAGQFFSGKEYHEVVLPYPPPLPMQRPKRDHSFFDAYCRGLERNGDLETRSSVESTYARMSDVLATRDAANQKVSGLVVGRVQSGKTRNYVGLALKAADEGWNVVFVLTSNNLALAGQTRDRLRNDFAQAGVSDGDALELEFLASGVVNRIPTALARPEGFLYWGLAMKERASLKRIRQWLSDASDLAHQMRVLVIDDEADNASQNTMNAGNGVMKEEDADLLPLVIQETDPSFGPLSEWSETIRNASFPEENGNSEASATMRRLVDTLRTRTGTNAQKRDDILHSVEFCDLLGLKIVRDANGNAVDLATLAGGFFHRAKGRGNQTAATFCSFLRFVLEVAMTRSAINAFIVDLIQTGVPGERTSPFQRTSYVAYTATPYANILNESPNQTPLYADFIQTLNENRQYFGAAKIFGTDRTANGTKMPIVRTLAKEELRFAVRPIQGLKDEGEDGSSLGYLSVSFNPDLEYETTDGNGRRVATGTWQSMRDAIAWSFCAAAVRSARRNGQDGTEREERWTTMLVNLSQLQGSHESVVQILRDHIDRCTERPDEFIIRCRAVWDRERNAFTKDKFDRLFNADNDSSNSYGPVDDYPSWEAIEPELRRFVELARGIKVHVIEVNSGNPASLDEYNQATGARQLVGDHLWILCGGNVISRGLTLPGLVCSYFDRFRKSSAVDTMTQMGRWFGYRRGYELLPRIWMDAATISEMKGIAYIETRMHAGMRENFDNGFSPCDESHHQEIFCYGRRLSGRNAGQTPVRSTGTHGSTLVFKTGDDNARRMIDATNRFLHLLGEPTDSWTKGYAYPGIRLWETVGVDTVGNFIEETIPNYPSESSDVLSSFVAAIRRDRRECVNVVLGEPSTGSESFSFPSGPSSRCSTIAPKDVRNGVARFDTLRLYLPFYAMIPERVLTELDCDYLANDIGQGTNGRIVPRLFALVDAAGGKLPASLVPILGTIPKEQIREGLLDVIQNVRQHPSMKLPPPIHQLLGYVSDGYRNRSSSDYMGEAHKRANHRRPVLQIQLFKPEGDAFADLTVPFCSLSFYWPGHNPDGFYAVTVC